jgi:hypothetical protein
MIADHDLVKKSFGSMIADHDLFFTQNWCNITLSQAFCGIMTIYIRPGIDPVAYPFRLRILLNSLKLMAKGVYPMSKMVRLIYTQH